MSHRALEIRPDGPAAQRLPILLVDAADEMSARALASAARGRIQVIVAGGDGREAYRFDGALTEAASLSEHEWSEVVGWKLRLGPSEAASVSVVDAPDWRVARIRLEVPGDAGSIRQLVYSLPAVDGADLTIGRGTENDVVVADPTVSRLHLSIERRSGSYVAVDRRPDRPDARRTPCLLDGAPFPSDGSAVPLPNGAVVAIGATRITFQAETRPIVRDAAAEAKGSEAQAAQEMAGERAANPAGEGQSLAEGNALLPSTPSDLAARSISSGQGASPRAISVILVAAIALLAGVGAVVAWALVRAF